jgi:hypothetical protein
MTSVTARRRTSTDTALLSRIRTHPAVGETRHHHRCRERTVNNVPMTIGQTCPEPTHVNDTRRIVEHLETGGNIQYLSGDRKAEWVAMTSLIVGILDRGMARALPSNLARPASRSSAVWLIERSEQT